jgi:oxygen-independent coproporphyrinogen-3 oxidase
VTFWRECGINRVSLGVQSFVLQELRQVGRRHTAEVVANDLAMLRVGGIANINLDLIAGLPGQTAASWHLSLDWLERLKAPHASIYLFEVDEESRLGKEVILGGNRYGASAMPDDDLCAELYEAAVERLRHMGIFRYEISNFARPGYESRHNLKYWQRAPYVGFGLDAHSFDGQYRWGNPDTVVEYFRQQENTGSVQAVRSETNASEERFFVGLRLAQGIAPSVEEWDQFAGPIEKWIKAGMLERVDNRLVLSERGYLVSNEIFQEFLHA